MIKLLKRREIFCFFCPYISSHTFKYINIYSDSTANAFHFQKHVFRKICSMLLVDLIIIKASIRPLNQSTRKPMLINPDKRTWTMSQRFDFTFIRRMKLRLFILCTLTYQIRRNIRRDSISQNRLCTKNKILIKDFFSICNKICGVMRIWSYLLMNSIMKIFCFCPV